MRETDRVGVCDCVTGVRDGVRVRVAVREAPLLVGVGVTHVARNCVSTVAKAPPSWGTV